MNTGLPDLSAFADEIARAFANVPRPSRITKRVAIALDDEWIVDNERGDELRAQDPEQCWQDLSESELRKFGAIVPWLDDEGLRFYLPAFMHCALQRFPRRDFRAISDIADLVTDVARFDAALDGRQRDLVRRFVSLYEL